MSKPVKIAINGTYVQEQASGLGVFTDNLITQLMSLSKFDYALYSHCDRFQAEYPDKTITVADSLSPDCGFAGHIKRLWWYQTGLRQQLKKQNAALFYSPAIEGMLFPSIPQIVTVHDLIPLKYPELSPKWQYYYRYFVPLLLKQSCKIVCISQHTKQDLIDNYQLNSDAINVVYLGFDRDLFTPQPNRDILKKYNLDKYLLYVGDMRFYKNLGRCLEAFDRISSKDCKFVITGKKDDFFYPEIERQTQQLAAKERIVFLDYVPTADLPGLYSLAQSLVFASLYEGFGLPVLEAMACGCPVIASNTTSIPEVGGNSVLYVDPYDVDSIAQEMQNILTNSHLRQDLRQKGLKRSQIFSWHQTAQDLQQILQVCLSG